MGVGILDKAMDYFKVQRQQIRLQLIGLIAKILSHLLGYIVMTIMVGLVIFFSGLGFGFYLNELLDSDYLGFFIVAVFFLIITIVVIVLSRSQIIQGWMEEAILNSSRLEDEEES